MSEIFEQDSLERLERRVNQQVTNLISRFSKGRIPDEPAFSVLLAETIAAAANDLVLEALPQLGFRSSGVSEVLLKAEPFSFAGRTLKHSGRGAEEKEFGADILLMLESEDGLVATKGLLAQAKAQRSNFSYTSDPKLFEQCDKMYSVTRTSSFVFVYATNGVHVFENPCATGSDVLKKRGALDIGSLVSAFVGCKRGDPEITKFEVGPFAEVASALRDRDFDAIGNLMDIDAAISFDVEPA